jgi:hypothetical protein
VKYIHWVAFISPTVIWPTIIWPTNISPTNILPTGTVHRQVWKSRRCSLIFLWILSRSSITFQMRVKKNFLLNYFVIPTILLLTIKKIVSHHLLFSI